MAYDGRPGRRPFEHASRAAHQHLINDGPVQKLLASCWMPVKAGEVDFSGLLYPQKPAPVFPKINHVIAVDGGYTEVAIREEFPSATLAFFQFGLLLFDNQDLRRLERQPFIDPADIAKLKNIDRLKLALPTRVIHLKTEGSLTHTVRRVLYDFFSQPVLGEPLIKTLAWLLFRRFNPNRGAEEATQFLSTNPHTESGVDLRESDLTASYTISCPETGKPIYLTDVFRLHERVDDELGAGGILGYVTSAVEQLLVAHFVRLLLSTKPEALKQLLFLKDGPTGFFGVTAPLHKPMQEMAGYLFEHHCFMMVGMEKSGTFVEHAREIASKMPEGHYLLLSNDYIYRYILPKPADMGRPYGDTSNYGHKLIFKTRSNQIYVASVPVAKLKVKPAPQDLPYLDTILAELESLRCDIYESALLPVALVNKLVSLSNHPSSNLLKRFASEAVKAEA